jgi:hypothetical protein
LLFSDKRPQDVNERKEKNNMKYFITLKIQ